MINVAKTYLPNKSKLLKHLDEIYDSQWVTNNGPKVKQLESSLKDYLEVDYFQFVSNGTIALQLAIKAIGLKKKIITTPFSYVATINSILWENCEPIFVDIDSTTGNIDENLIEENIDKDVSAIMAVHVYGNPCNVEVIGSIAKKYNLRVIYDAAHAFGVKYKGKSILMEGDISTLSFHATKVFHTIEGGGIVSNNEELDNRLFLLKSFGHNKDDYQMVGINAKNSEFHASVGLTLLDEMKNVFELRKVVTHTYDNYIDFNSLYKFQYNKDATKNYSYYPVIFQSETALLAAVEKLNSINVFPRRYFNPSLNQLPFTNKFKCSCPVAEDISRRVLCLPLYPELSLEDVKMISDRINSI